MAAATFSKMERLGLEYFVSRTEPDVDMIFLANKEASTLGTACARGETDIHVTGMKTSDWLLATTVPQKKVSRIHTFNVDDSLYHRVHLSDRCRINITTSRVALAIDGTVVDTISGQASVSLVDALENYRNGRSTVVNVTYQNWNATSSIVEISTPRFINLDTGDPVDIRFDGNADEDESCKNAQSVLEQMYTKASKLRSVVVYKPAPPLSKSVMRVPYGIDGTTFDSVCSVADRPPPLSDSALESLIEVCLSKSLSIDEPGSPSVEMQTFMNDARLPGLAACRHSEKVCNALSTLVSLLCPYRVDGRTAVLPTGLSMVASESWKAEAPRTLFSSDDCDGSMAVGLSIVYQAERIARDQDLSQQYPCLTAASNALVHHMVGVCVLSANAGQADAAGDQGHEVVAGHAIALAIPKTMALKSMLTGIMSTGTYQNGATDSQELMLQKVTKPYATSLYHADDLKRMDPKEAELLSNPEGVLNLSGTDGLVALAIEGTSPVASAKLYEPDATVRLQQIELARDEKMFESQMGPAITRNLTRLHVPIDHSGPDHQFYKHVVEFAVPLRRYGTFQNEDMRTMELATAQWVFAQPHDVQSAGVSPKELATGNFSMLPLWKLSTDDCTAMDTASNDVMKNTLPMRSGPTKLTETEYSIYKTNVESLKKLSEHKSSLFDGMKEHKIVNRHVISFAALVKNDTAVKLFSDTAMQNKSLGCRVSFSAVNSLLTSPDDDDVGVVPYIEIVSI